MHANSGWNALYLENHDQPRSTSRFLPVANTDPSLNPKVSTMLSTWLGCQQGTVFVYQGQELGMSNVPVHWEMAEYKDVDCLNHWKLLQHDDSESEMPQSLKAIQEVAKGEYQKKSRDNARTPMQWTKGAHAGFTSPDSKTPWMTANPNFESVNAEAQVGVAGSVWSYWKKMLQVRKAQKEVIVYGNFALVESGDAELDEKVAAYERKSQDGHKLLVVCNFTAEKVNWKIGQNIQDVVLSNYGRKAAEIKETVQLEAYEAVALLI